MTTITMKMRMPTITVATITMTVIMAMPHWSGFGNPDGRGGMESIVETGRYGSICGSKLLLLW